MAVYDIGKIQKDLIDFYIKAKPPRVTPEQLWPLIGKLEEVTLLAENHRAKVATYLQSRGGLTATLWEQWRQADRDLTEWRGRLTAYKTAIETCPAADAECILWTVTAPMFLGFYGGATSTEPQRASDVTTPFKIANTLGEIVDADVVSNWSAAWDALVEAVVEMPSVVSDAVDGTLRAAGGALGAGAKGINDGLGTTGTIVVVAAAIVGLWYFVGRKPANAEG